MNYKKHYISLINRAKDRKINGYTETHHIIPRCMNGTDDKDNLVDLTAREHFIAHLLLLKIYPKQYSLIKAVMMMTVSNSIHREHRSMNRMYSWLKEHHSKEMSRLQTGEKNSQHGTMWIHNLELKESKKIPKGDIIPEGWLKGRVIDFSVHFRNNKEKLIKEEKQEHKEKNKEIEAIKLFDLYLKSDCISIRDFVRTTDYWDKSFYALTLLFKKYVKTYRDNVSERYSNKEIMKEKHYGGVAQLEER